MYTGNKLFPHSLNFPKVNLYLSENNKQMGQYSSISNKNKIEQEKQTIKLMIELYCRKIEKNQVLCNDCKELIEYAHKKLDRCKYGNNKSTCKKCKTHCYPGEKREKIRMIMRTIGPRMIFYAPLAALRHLFDELR